MRSALVVLTAALATAATLASAAGCAPSQGTRTHSQLRTLQKETRWQELYERGRAFAAVGDFTRAEEYFGAALDTGGDSQKLIPLILYCCMQDGRYLLAAQYAEEHLQKHPNDYRTRFVLGSIYAGIGQEAQAERELARVVEAKPDEAEAHYALGKILWDGRKSYGAADRHFREYLRLTPSGPHAAEAKERLLHAVPATPEAAGAKTGPSPEPAPANMSAPVPEPLAPDHSPSGKHP